MTRLRLDLPRRLSSLVTISEAMVIGVLQNLYIDVLLTLVEQKLRCCTACLVSQSFVPPPDRL